MRIIDKSGPLHNPADRDHCLQYMIAVALLDGSLSYPSYEEQRAKDPRIDALRARMRVREDPDYSRRYLDPAERDVANALQVFFRDGSATQRVEIRKPLGHPARRREALPYVVRKLDRGLHAVFEEAHAARIREALDSRGRLERMLVGDLMQLVSLSPSS